MKSRIWLNQKKSQRTTLVGTLRKTLLLRGSCCEISIWKQEFSKAQVLWNEIGDRYSEIIEIAQDHEMRNVEAIWEQIVVNGMTLKRMRGKKLNTWSKQCWILVLSVLL